MKHKEWEQHFKNEFGIHFRGAAGELEWMLEDMTKMFKQIRNHSFFWGLTTGITLCVATYQIFIIIVK